MINLFHIPHYTIDTSKLGHLLHGNIIREFEEEFADYVGAKYACSVSSATAGIFLTFQGPWASNLNIVQVPSVIPYVVPSVLTQCKNVVLDFNDNIEWVGHAYTLHYFFDDHFKVIDSAQEVTKDQFKLQANPDDLIIYSFYPTKPIGGADGGMVVSNDKEKIDWFRMASMYGARRDKNTWDSWARELEFPGFKMYANSLQAYIALQNLRKLDEKKDRLEEIRSFYNTQLGYNNTSHHLYRIEVRDNIEFIKKMNTNGIQVGVHYHPCHLMDAYQKYWKKTNKILPLAELEANHTASIPFNEKLTKEELEYIVEKIYENK